MAASEQETLFLPVAVRIKCPMRIGRFIVAANAHRKEKRTNGLEKMEFPVNA